MFTQIVINLKIKIMKKIGLFMVMLLIVGCGVQHTGIVNNTQSITTINLSGNNYRIIDKVSAKATATYIMGIGGLRNKALIEKAKAGLYEKANLTGSARAIAYIAYDTHYSFIFPFYYRVTVTASGFVLEYK